VYDSPDGTFGITGTLTLDAQGDPNATFIFKTASTVITAADSNVDLINDARTSNVLWSVGSSVALGMSSSMSGTILATTDISMGTDATLNGRALSRTGEVTLDSNMIARPVDTPQSIMATSIVVTTSTNPGFEGQPITFTATVTADGDQPAYGLVVFMDKGTRLGTGMLDNTGVATLTISTLTVNRHPIKTIYLGSDGFMASTSRTISQFVFAAE
jgi:hypothetical protein